jgi:hypothetical protein
VEIEIRITWQLWHWKYANHRLDFLDVHKVYIGVMGVCGNPQCTIREVHDILAWRCITRYNCKATGLIWAHWVFDSEVVSHFAIVCTIATDLKLSNISEFL